MADDDFDIDIYGDDNTEPEVPAPAVTKGEERDAKVEDTNENNASAVDIKTEKEQDSRNVDANAKPDDQGDQPEQQQQTNADPKTELGNQGDQRGQSEQHQQTKSEDIKVEQESHEGRPGQHEGQSEEQQQIKSTDESANDAFKVPKQAPQQQGVKRKEGSDERPIDPGATTAILISDLHWWNTDDDIRGWVNQAQCEDELKEVTFSEHKVNGKSKGQAYVEFSSQQAATAAKRKIDAFGEGQQYAKKHTVAYSNPSINPFRALPKDGSMRKDGIMNRPASGFGNQHVGPSNYGNFRGRTPGYNASRGNMNNMGGGFNRNFPNQGMGGVGGGFQAPMGGYNGGGMGGQFGGGFNRGGMMNNMRGGPANMRGGRGGMNPGMMGPMPMGPMPMGPMPMRGMPGAMPGMGAPMNMGMGAGMPAGGFPPMQPHFNPAFFPANQGASGDWQNPHGAKRQRPE